MLRNFDDIMGVKYKYLKRHFKKKYNKLLHFYILSTFEREQIDFIEQIELDIE